MRNKPTERSILIIGGGTWGCATALELGRRGYEKVTVLDSHSVPSAISAGNDLNKIMEEGKISRTYTFGGINRSPRS